jgi:hypothetical protein
MANLEKTGGAEEMPLQGTMEMIGVKPGAVENKAEAAESYRDIGEQRLAAAAEKIRNFGSKAGGFMGRAWDRIKSFGSKTKEAGKAALVYTMAAPEMVGDVTAAAAEKIAEAPDYVLDKAGEGMNYVAEKGAVAVEGAKDLGMRAAMRTFEAGVTAYDKTAEGAVYVSEKVKGACEGAVNFGREKYAGLQRRAEDARGIFQAAVNEARRRRQERLAREQGNSEYEKLLEDFQSAKERVRAFEARFAGGRSAGAAA